MIGFLGSPRSADRRVQAFQQGLLDFGYVEGRNVNVEYRYNITVRGNLDRRAQLAAELVGLKPNVLAVSLIEVALVAKNAISAIPIVMANVADPSPPRWLPASRTREATSRECPGKPRN